jgi:LysR family nitrogen assimilation transcriptional regulator
LDLKQLEYFVQVAELRSFTRASEALGISQPSLSRQVRLLELELSERLLLRTGRGVEPTEAGKVLVGYGNAMLNMATRAREDIGDLKHMPRGRIRVGLPPRLAHLLTPVLVQAFRRELPGASIAVSEGPSVKMRDWLMNGQVDVALFYDPVPSSKLDYESVFQEELLLVGRTPGVGDMLPSKIRLSQLANYPIVLPCMPHTIRAIVDATCQSRSVAINVVAEVDAVQTLVAVVERGDSFAILPTSSVAKQVRAGLLRAAHIHAPVMRNHLILATARFRPTTRLALSTVQLFRALKIPDLLLNA